MNLTDFFDKPNWPEHTDWRLPENRLEAFRRVAYTRLVEGDLDHHHVGKVIVDMMKLDKDQQALYCLLFGQSYRNHWAMIVLQQFPNILDVPNKQLVEWHNDNWKRMFYAKDTKWGVRKFPAFVESIRQRIGNHSPYEYYQSFACSDPYPNINFLNLNAELRELHGIGRMTAWLAQQTFYELFDWPIDFPDVQLYDDTWSQFDSLCYLFNREDLAYNKEKKSEDSIHFMEKNFYELYNYCNENSDIHMDVYNLESCLCEYRKTAAPRKKPKEFTFWTSTELAMQFHELKAAWPEIDWMPYATGLMAKGENVIKYWYSPSYFSVIVDHGLNLNTHHYFKDEPNAFELLGLPQKATPETQVLFDYWNSNPDKDFLREKYNPKNYLRMQ